MFQFHIPHIIYLQLAVQVTPAMLEELQLPPIWQKQLSKLVTVPHDTPVIVGESEITVPLLMKENKNITNLHCVKRIKGKRTNK